KESDILEGRYTPEFKRLAESFAGKARGFYQAAREGLPSEDRKSMIAAELMGTVYWKLLKKIESREYQVLGAVPMRLSKPRKICLVLYTWLRHLTGTMGPTYGV
ncbi:MAG: squalene/phytoene synthase family protein, partial [Limisphaerales bacterium]